jgi:hypothetical protein
MQKLSKAVLIMTGHRLGAADRRSKNIVRVRHRGHLNAQQGPGQRRQINHRSGNLAAPRLTVGSMIERQVAGGALSWSKALATYVQSLAGSPPASWGPAL